MTVRNKLSYQLNRNLKSKRKMLKTSNNCAKYQFMILANLSNNNNYLKSQHKLQSSAVLHTRH